MSLQLSDEELWIIESWYHSAAGESASGLELGSIEDWRKEYHHEYPARLEGARKVKALLDKLGFEYADIDKYQMKKSGLL